MTPRRVVSPCRERSAARLAAAFMHTDHRPVMNSTPGQPWVSPIRLVIGRVCVTGCDRCLKRRTIRGRETGEGKFKPGPLNQFEQIGVGRFKLGESGNLQVVADLLQINAQSADRRQLRMSRGDILVQCACGLAMVTKGGEGGVR